MLQLGVSTTEPVGAPLTSVDASFGATINYGFALKDPRYATDREVWEALNNEPNTAIVASIVVPARSDIEFAEDREIFQLEGFFRDGDSLPETFIEVFDQTEQRSVRLRIIGVLDEWAPPRFVGLGALVLFIFARLFRDREIIRGYGPFTGPSLY